MRRTIIGTLVGCVAVAGCGRVSQVGQTPPLSTQAGPELIAMSQPPEPVRQHHRADPASLWTRGPSSLLGDRRAAERGDILTVVIDIDESAEFDNSSERSRSSNQDLGIGALFGLPEALATVLPGEASLETAARINSDSAFNGDGSISREEQLELRVAATVVEVLSNGALRVQGTQEVRVNNEVRVLFVTGFVRPEDISRRNEITYDKIASARISYGGRGHLTDVQRPRYGQEAADVVLPF